MNKLINVLKKYKITLLMLVIIGVLFVVDFDMGSGALKNTGSNITTMLRVLPPILVLIGLIDSWISKETMIKFMGHGSGIKGIIVAILLGSLAAGPLYVAFPIAAILMKKGARFAYVLFFIGVWSSSKLPLLVFEFTSLGATFTIIHIISNLTVFLIGSFIIEKILGKKQIDKIYETASLIGS